MALDNPSSGFFSVNEYQVSPLPWAITSVTSGVSVASYTLPRVSKNIVITNLETGATKFLRLGFTLNGVNGVEDNYYIVIPPDTTLSFDVRMKQFFVRADSSNTINFSIFCGLTTISEMQMPTLTGSLSDGSVGWSGVG